MGARRSLRIPAGYLRIAPIAKIPVIASVVFSRGAGRTPVFTTIIRWPRNDI